MRPDKLSVHDLFQKERRYVVPLYQRAYVWNEADQWEPLWEDIERQADACLSTATGVPRRSHFLGAVVLNVQKIENFVIFLPISLDPRDPVARHLKIVPPRYAFRPRFDTWFA